MSHNSVTGHFGRLAYRLEGDGPPLLLLHGWGVTYRVWQNLAPLLHAYFQLIMVELPGNGASPALPAGASYYPGCADVLDELREHLGLPSWAVLAYSSGTRAGEAYIDKYAHRVVSAVLLCPINIRLWCYIVMTMQWWLERFAPRAADWVLSGRRLRFILQVIGFNGRHHDFLDVWQKEIERQALSTIKPMLYELPGRGRAPYVPPAARTLYVWGRRDILSGPPRQLGPDDAVIDGMHSAPLLQAPQVAEVVLRFLSEEQEKAS